MPEMTVEQAQARLSVISAYDWLTKSGRQLWSADDVAEELGKAGMSVTSATVSGWFKTMPNHQPFGGRGGTWAPREDLLVYFANRFANPSISESASA